MTTLTEAVDRQAETRLLRAIVANFGISTIVFFFLTVGSIVEQWAHLSPVWSVIAVAVIFAAPPVIAVASLRLGPTAIERILGSYAIASLVIAISYRAALIDGPIPMELHPWPLTIIALATVPAALAFSESIALGYLIAYSVAAGFVRFLSASDAQLAVAIQDAVFTFTFAGLFTALAVVIMRSAKALDAAARAARATAVRRASVESSQREQARLDALLHDDVMSTLYYASTGTPELDVVIRRQAAHALAELRRGGEHPDSAVDVTAFTSRIRAVALSGPAGATSFTVEGHRDAPVPADVDAAFAEAAAEAVRNSFQHAGKDGRAVTRSMTMALSESAIRLSIVDDGVGFDVRTIRPHRLGILVSIRGRMNAIAGGRARIESVLGHGTRVDLDWTAS